MAGYTIDQVDGMIQTPAALAQEFVEFEGAVERRVRDVFLESGLLRRYRQLYLLTYPDAPDPAVYTVRRVIVSIFEYPDAATAAREWDDLARFLGRDAPELSSGVPPIGAESRLSRADVPYLYLDATYPELTLTFRSERLVASVAIRDDLGEATPAEAETLATRLLERMERVVAGESPWLSRFALRYVPEAVMTGPFEGYNLLGGSVVVRNGRYDDVFHPLLATAAAGAGALDGYDLANALVMDGGGWDGNHGSTIYRFPDEDAAAVWLHALPSRLATTTARELHVTAAPGIGNQAFVATYESEPTDIIRYHRIDAVQTGPLVAILTGTRVTPREARDLLTAQAACLADGGCAGPLPMPLNILDRKSGFRTGR
jgi:hypothetical protein